jgi:hypothetical protein
MGAKLLVGIGPEGGLRYNSPLESVTLFRRGHDQGPLRRRTEFTTETSFLAKLANSTLLPNYFYFDYSTLGRNKMLKPKALESN